MAKHEQVELSDSEKRDLTERILTGKYIPERYRFLLFEDKNDIELVWNGKNRDVCNTVLPFQVLEHIDEPRKESFADEEFIFDLHGRQKGGWTNKLIWGDNKLILSSLRGGPLRREIDDAGGIKLIYIDPPFDVGADFSMDIEVGGQAFHKEPNILEQIAYRDTWGKKSESFIAMIYERLILMRDLLHSEGSIYIHCDWRVTSYLRCIIEEVFGPDAYRNEIIWQRTNAHNDSNQFGRVHDTIHFATRNSNEYIWHPDPIPFSPEQLARYKRDEKGRHYTTQDLTAPRTGSSSGKFEWRGTMPSPSRGWGYTKDQLEKWWAEGRIATKKDGTPRMDGLIVYLDEKVGQSPQTVWRDVSRVTNTGEERLGYPTQKPEALLKRIINASSNKGDIVADFFCGSGTTAAVAEKLGRRWICSDLGKFALHTSRKRLIEVQRELKKSNCTFRPFEILNLGKYQRHVYVTVSHKLTGKAKEKALASKEKDFREMIIRAYKALPLANDDFFHGKTGNRVVVIGPVNLPVTRLFVEEVTNQCRQRGITRCDLLAFEYELGLFPAALDEAKQKGIDLVTKTIPPDVFDRRAVDAGEVEFHEVSYIEATPRYDKKDPRKAAIELSDFSVYHQQGRFKKTADELKEGKSAVICDAGQLLKVSKDKDGKIKKELLTKKWHDWIDYWAVDFDYESRKEIIKRTKGFGAKGEQDVFIPEPGSLVEYEEVWSGNYIFENEWQSFRTKKDRELELTSAWHTYTKPGKHIIAVKVVDIFGNDTMSLVTINIP